MDQSFAMVVSAEFRLVSVVCPGALFDAVAKYGASLLPVFRASQCLHFDDVHGLDAPKRAGRGAFDALDLPIESQCAKFVIGL